jgi:hypothetical protein
MKMDDVDVDVDVSVFGVNKDVAEAYTEALCRHIACVREAGRKLGVLSVLLEVHDQSKWSVFEFPGYSRHFRGDGKNHDEFAAAWLHHIHCNPHHWQHWIFPDGYSPEESSVENGVVRMPDDYALEMVADWMGVSRAFTGSWDMRDWLRKNVPRIMVHSETAKYLGSVLRDLGYADVFRFVGFKVAK